MAADQLSDLANLESVCLHGVIHRVGEANIEAGEAGVVAGLRDDGGDDTLGLLECKICGTRTVTTPFMDSS